MAIISTPVLGNTVGLHNLFYKLIFSKSVYELRCSLCKNSFPWFNESLYTHLVFTKLLSNGNKPVSGS